jgi:hypothetical protein
MVNGGIGRYKSGPVLRIWQRFRLAPLGRAYRAAHLSSERVLLGHVVIQRKPTRYYATFIESSRMPLGR